MESLNSSIPTHRRRLPMRGAVIVTLLIIVVAGLLFTATTYGKQKSSSKAKFSSEQKSFSPTLPTSVRTVTVCQERGAMQTEQLSGILEARHVVTVSAEVAARVLRRPLDRGDRIAEGDLIALLDARTATANVAQAQAGLAQATATRRQAEAEYQRVQTETASAIDSARANLASAAADETKTRSFTRTQELRQAEATLSQAQTDEKLAKIERDRYARLVEAGAVAQQSLDRVQATYDSAVARTQSAQESVSLAQEGARREDIARATAQVQNARANLHSANSRPARLTAIREQIASLVAQEASTRATLENARIQLSRHRILSPIQGRVLETRIESGEMASPGSPLMVLADVRDLRAVFAVPESARPLLKTGQKVTLTTDAFPGKSFPARITVLDFQGDGKTRTFRVEVAVANPEEILLPNMTTRLSLPVGATTERLTIPVSAVATDSVTGETFVLVVPKSGEVSRCPVTLGEPIGTDSVRVLQGLVGGETILADPDRQSQSVH